MQISTNQKRIAAALRMVVFTAIVMIAGGLPDALAQNIKLRVRADLEFGRIDVANMPGTTALGTNGTISYTGGLVGDGFGSAGRIQITGQGHTTVDISCSTTATISNGLDTIDVTHIEMVLGRNNGTSPGGSGISPCLGIGLTSIQMTTGPPTVSEALIAATLVATGSESGGSYDTGSTGGIPIIIEMVIP